MNCAYHPDREVQGICSSCGRPICQDCLVDIKGQTHCKSCIEARMKRPARDVVGPLRFVLSVVPGLGHLYMGMFNRGLQLMAGTFLGATLLNAIFDDLSVFFVFAMIFISVFDAREAALRIQQGLEVEDKGFVDLKTWKFEKMTWNSKYIGYGLVVIGGLALYKTLMNDLLRLIFGYNAFYRDLAATLNGVVLGGLAVGAGVWLLRKSL